MLGFLHNKDKGTSGRAGPLANGAGVRTLGGSHSDRHNGNPQLSAVAVDSGVITRFAGGAQTDSAGGDLAITVGSAVIESLAELAQVSFHGSINDKLALAPHLQAKVAVVQLLDSSNEVMLFFVDGVAPELLNEVVGVVRRKGFHFPESGIQAYRAANTIVTSIAKGHVGQEQINNYRQIAHDRTKSALWSTFIDIVQWAFDNEADDIDFVASTTHDKSQVKFKMAGKYIAPPRFSLPSDTLLQLLGIAWQQARGVSDSYFQVNVEQQCLIDVDLARGQRVRLRWNGMPSDDGVVVTQRLHRRGNAAKFKTWESGGYLPWHVERFERALLGEGGLVVFSGTVGSGKSTALAQLMTMLPSDRKAISFEDPVEIELPNVIQKTIARDMLSSSDRDPAFEAAVRGLFRSALDAFLLSEIRDRATGRVARAVVESGHSTLTTVHAGSAPLIFDRLCSPEIDIPLGVLAAPGNVRMAVFQALLPRVCEKCGLTPQEYAQLHELKGDQLEHHHRYFERLERMYRIDRSKYRLVNHRGCDRCRTGREDLCEFWGTTGRTVAIEMIDEPDDQMLALLLAGNKVGLRQYWRSMSTGNFEDGDFTGKTAVECAIYKASMGQIDPRDIERKFKSFMSIEAQHGTKKESR